MTQTLSANKEELAKSDQALRSMAGRVRKTIKRFISFHNACFSLLNTFSSADFEWS